jgi:pimeloyl-ACP methyl ester carboxylesterase
MGMRVNKSAIMKGALASLAALAGMAVVNEQVASRRPPVISALAGEGRRFVGARGSIFYKVAGREGAAPMVLLHGIYAAGSGWEMRKLHGAFADEYRVYTPDLLGFGLSDHPALDYRAEVYIQSLLEFMAGAVRREEGQAPVVVASTLTCSFVIAAAARRPELFGALVLIEPVGITQLASEPGLVSAAVYTLFKAPVLGEFLFNLLASRMSIRWFLQRQGYLDARLVTPEVVEANYAVAHQPNAHYAPGAFVAGALNRNIRAEFARLTKPILLTWGYQSSVVPVQSATAFLQANPRAEIIGFDAAGLPHDETATAFVQQVGDWLQERAKDVGQGLEAGERPLRLRSVGKPQA